MENGNRRRCCGGGDDPDNAGDTMIEDRTNRGALLAGFVLAVLGVIMVVYAAIAGV